MHLLCELRTARGLVVLAPRANSALIEVTFDSEAIRKLVEDFNENFSTRALSRPVLRDMRDRKQCVPGKTQQ